MDKKKVSDMLLALATELEKDSTDEPSKKEDTKARPYVSSSITKKKIIEYVKGHGGATVHDIAEGVGISNKTTAYGHTKKLVDEAELVKRGLRHYMPESAPVNDETKVVESDNQTDKVDEQVERVLEFVSKNMGKRYSVNQMAKECGVPLGSINRLVHGLLKKGTIPKGFNLGETLLEDTKEAPQKEPNLAQNIEFLVWKFVRETRSTDVLQFLTWLERK